MRFFILITFYFLAACSSQESQRSANNKSREILPKYISIERPLVPEAVEVRLFVEDDNTIGNQESYIDPEGVILKNDQVNELESMMIFKRDDREYAAACFVPHHYFKYYDKNGKIISEILVCFCCESIAFNGVNIQDHEGYYYTTDYKYLKKFIKSLGQRTDVYCRERG